MFAITRAREAGFSLFDANIRVREMGFGSFDGVDDDKHIPHGLLEIPYKTLTTQDDFFRWDESM